MITIIKAVRKWDSNYYIGYDAEGNAYDVYKNQFGRWRTHSPHLNLIFAVE